MPDFTDSPSSMISGHAYDPETGRLSVRFRKGGNVGHFEGVEPSTYEAFAASDSHGTFFHSRIKGAYEHEAGDPG